MNRIRWALAVVVPFFVVGCAGTRVKRVDVKETIDLSGRWNDTDSRLVAEEMIQDGLHRPWVDAFYERRKRPPVVIVGPVVNRTEEHINTEVFTKDLERSLLNSGRVKLVASAGERGALREERTAQNTEGQTAAETVKAMGRELGADLMLIGSVNSVKDETKGRYVILYQANLELIDLETNEKVWVGQKYIKKVVRRPSFSL